MIARFIKEGKRYSLSELARKYSCEENKILRALKKLRETGVLRLVKNTYTQKMKNDLLEDEEVLASSDEEFITSLFVFKFVGIVIVSDFIFKCYPKYIQFTSKESGLKLALKVIEKYERTSQRIPLYNDMDIDKPYNTIATIIYILNDYYENGFYEKEETIYETNGEGEINWDRTINETFALIKNNRPFYPDIFTKKNQFDKFNYFKRLHQVIIAQCSLVLEKADLLEYFNLIPFYDSTEDLEGLGDNNYIMYQLEKEINIQFNTRLKTVLKLMYIYISQNRSFNSFEEVTIYGTTSFYNVWEFVCQETLENDLKKPLEQVFDKNQLPEKFHGNENTLLSIIEKPKWNIEHSATEVEILESSGTFIPDCITVRDKFNIYDAKYFVPTIREEVSIEGQPGISDVSKQFLYQLAYQNFFESFSDYKINNYFLLPSEIERNERVYVSMDMFTKIGLSNIEVIFLEVNNIFETYLSGKTIRVG
ncbi:LlaJI family restriction endonuclease [Fundicoccus ignavus]|uniref:LlaJI family restriction endonuclease n=1 Tax=Fundicoccus ignavus TaxID=2664442 RepID=A0A844CC75_9LACT|nr:LlaJI family restriction endonuclease [Fundicoccus ignavus]MRJ47111.1 LlaJI family restriction endonuclease [Fundicoccus ignavus]